MEKMRALDVSDLEDDDVCRWLAELPIQSEHVNLLLVSPGISGVRIPSYMLQRVWKDLWYRLTDDLWVTDESESWLLELDHAEVFSFWAVPKARELPQPPEQRTSKLKSRIMYVEHKSGQSDCRPAWIGRVFFSKTGKTLYYRGKAFRSLKGGFCANYFDVKTGEEYWISRCKKNGQDRHWAGGGRLVSTATCGRSIGPRLAASQSIKI